MFYQIFGLKKWANPFALSGVILVLGFSDVKGENYSAGAARVDITPTEPVWLSGYAGRSGPHTGVAMPIAARTLILGPVDRAADAVVLVSIDSCGVPAELAGKMAVRIAEVTGLQAGRVTVCSTHSHSCPALPGFAPAIFMHDIEAGQRAAMDRYAAWLIDRVGESAKLAVAARGPVTLWRQEGRVTFAKNRRTPGGPTDYSAPILCCRAADGTVRALVTSYACHATTLLGSDNEVHPDWPGVAAVELEKSFPGAIALVCIGSGADADPQPRGTEAMALAHGTSLALEAATLVRNAMQPVTGSLAMFRETVQLPFAPPPGPEVWEKRRTESGILGYLAPKRLQNPPASATANGSAPDRARASVLPFTTTLWAFGDDMAWLFLTGEVVVDYTRWVRATFDPQRVMITAYAHDVPCYIPSGRILQEGGYEAEGAMWYFDRPGRLAESCEEMIHASVTRLMPPGYLFNEKLAENPPPISAAASAASLRVAGGLQIEQVAAEPVVLDPVAFDWDARGRLWVVEMPDRPLGMDGKGKPGGRLKRLEDRDGDGRFDHAVILREGLSYPSGILCWGDGVFVCAAPDILFLADRDNDGHAEVMERRYSGWQVANGDALVNGLELGLDGWIHGSTGLFGAKIRRAGSDEVIDLTGRDFRFHPVTGVIVPAIGCSQHGRVRNDWGQWFSCENAHQLWHYPWSYEAAQRNPHVPPPSPLVDVPAGPDSDAVFPTSRTIERFNDFHMQNRITSACGLGVYRDDWLGPEYEGNIFVCEPVHNLVRRHVLSPHGATWASHRAPDEAEREFFSGRDSYFRPVQARTGPDGALWVADMSRFVIEHPDWISSERLKTLDVRAGEFCGRLYRLRVPGKPLRAVRDLTALPDGDLLAAFDSPNGTERDRVQAAMQWRWLRAGTSAPEAAALAFRSMLRHSSHAGTRAHALALLELIGKATRDDFQHAIHDSASGVRMVAVRLSPPHGIDLKIQAIDASSHVRFETALATRDPESLARLAEKDAGDEWMRAAILSSSAGIAADVLKAIAALPEATAAPLEQGRQQIIEGLLASVTDARSALPTALASDASGHPAPWQWRTLAQWLERGDILPADVPDLLDKAKATASAGQSSAGEALRVAAGLAADARWIASFLNGPLSATALAELSRLGDPLTPSLLLADWAALAPAERQARRAALLSRPLWRQPLIDAVKSATIAKAELTPAEQQILAAHSVEAASLFTAPPLRTDVITRYTAVDSLQGNPERGGTLYSQACASCHRLGHTGLDFGPDLSPYAGKKASELAVAVLNPNASITAGFTGYTVETRDGRVRAGLVKQETATQFTLLQPGGLSDVIARTSVAALTPLPLSLMPEGLEAVLPPQELADLAAWIRQRGPASWGSATPSAMAAAREVFLKESPLAVPSVTRGYTTGTYHSWVGSRPLHVCQHNIEHQQLEWKTPPVSTSLLPPGESVTLRFAVGMGYLSQPAGPFFLRAAGHEVAQFDVTLADKEWPGSSPGTGLRYTVREANNEDSCGVLHVTIPRTWIELGSPLKIEASGTNADSKRWFGIYEP